MTDGPEAVQCLENDHKSINRRAALARASPDRDAPDSTPISTVRFVSHIVCGALLTGADSSASVLDKQAPVQQESAGPSSEGRQHEGCAHLPKSAP
jgi:hypothetical protein